MQDQREPGGIRESPLKSSVSYASLNLSSNPKSEANLTSASANISEHAKLLNLAVNLATHIYLNFVFFVQLQINKAVDFCIYVCFFAYCNLFSVYLIVYIPETIIFSCLSS